MQPPAIGFGTCKWISLERRNRVTRLRFGSVQFRMGQRYGILRHSQQLSERKRERDEQPKTKTKDVSIHTCLLSVFTMFTHFFEIRRLFASDGWVLNKRQNGAHMWKSLCISSNTRTHTHRAHLIYHFPKTIILIKLSVSKAHLWSKLKWKRNDGSVDAQTKALSIVFLAAAKWIVRTMLVFYCHLFL